MGFLYHMARGVDKLGKEGLTKQNFGKWDFRKNQEIEEEEEK